MCVEAMTEKGEISFDKECKRLLDLRDEIGTKGDKKHAKPEAKARLKHKYLVDGFNAVQKRYLASCLRMRSTPEKQNIDSKHMRVEAMIEKG